MVMCKLIGRFFAFCNAAAGKQNLGGMQNRALRGALAFLAAIWLCVAGIAGAAVFIITIDSTAPRDGLNDLALAFSNAVAFDVTDIKSSVFRKATETRDAAKLQAGIAYFDPPAALKKGDKVTSTIKTDSAQSKYKFTKGVWTQDGTPKDEIAAKDIGWKVAQEISINDATFGLQNDSDGFLTFTRLSFELVSTELPDLAPVFSLSGFTPFASLLTLSPQSASTDFLFSGVPHAGFLYIEGNAFVSDSSGNPLSDAIQFRVGARLLSEPLSSYLFCAALVLLVVLPPVVSRLSNVTGLG
jgi:hypothetical protein